MKATKKDFKRIDLEKLMKYKDEILLLKENYLIKCDIQNMLHIDDAGTYYCMYGTYAAFDGVDIIKLNKNKTNKMKTYKLIFLNQTRSRITNKRK